MTQKIGDGASAARASIEAALRRHTDATSRAREGQSPATTAATGSDFKSAILDGIDQMDASAKQSDTLVQDVITGRVTDFHEVALRLKESELSFRYSMEVRNKFVDAYREVMRMSV